MHRSDRTRRDRHMGRRRRQGASTGARPRHRRRLRPLPRPGGRGPPGRDPGDGGKRVTFKNLEVDCTTARQRGDVHQPGRGRQGRPTDVVCDGCTLKKGPTRNRVLRISDSLTLGRPQFHDRLVRHGSQCEKARRSSSSTPPPIPSTRTTGSSSTATADRRHRFRRARCRLRSGFPASPCRAPRRRPEEQLVARAVAGIPQGEHEAGRHLRAAPPAGRRSGSRQNLQGRRHPVCVRRAGDAKGKLLTGLVGVTNKGATLNRSFTLRVAAPQAATAAGAGPGQHSARSVAVGRLASSASPCRISDLWPASGSSRRSLWPV